MTIALILSVLLIALGALWSKRIADHDNDGDLGAALFAVGLIALGAVSLLITLLVFAAKHVHWGWS